MLVSRHRASRDTSFPATSDAARMTGNDFSVFAVTAVGLISDHGSSTRTRYEGVCAIEGFYELVMAPQDEAGVGIYDFSSGEFYQIPAVGETHHRKYSGCVAVGSTIYLTPLHASGVGVVRRSSSGYSFSSVNVHNGAMFKWMGAALSPHNGHVCLGDREKR